MLYDLIISSVAFVAHNGRKRQVCRVALVVKSGTVKSSCEVVKKTGLWSIAFTYTPILTSFAMKTDFAPVWLLIQDSKSE